MLLLFSPLRTFAFGSLGPGATGGARCSGPSHQRIRRKAGVGPLGAVVSLVPSDTLVVDYHPMQGDWCQSTLHSCTEPKEKLKGNTKARQTTRW